MKSRLCKVQFEGTLLFRCDLREADLRSASFYGATLKDCEISKDTKFGDLPEDHPDAVLKSDDPEDERHKREVILKDLIPDDTLSHEDIVEKVRAWQKEGSLILLPGSNPEYFLHKPPVTPAAGVR